MNEPRNGPRNGDMVLGGRRGSPPPPQFDCPEPEHYAHCWRHARQAIKALELLTQRLETLEQATEEEDKKILEEIEWIECILKHATQKLV